MIQQQIKSLIEFFYPPFNRLMPINTFRYAVCGCINVLLDVGLFYIFYNFVFQKQNIEIGSFVFKPHIAAFLGSFFITFPIGFFLSKYVVWSTSNVKGHIQLFRYFVMIMMNFLLNYVFLKLFVEYFHIYPTISKIMTTGIVVIFSYLTQKHYAFKVRHLNHN